MAYFITDLKHSFPAGPPFCLIGQVTGKDTCILSVDRFHVFDHVDKEDKGQADELDGDKNRRETVKRRNF